MDSLNEEDVRKMQEYLKPIVSDVVEVMSIMHLVWLHLLRIMYTRRRSIECVLRFEATYSSHTLFFSSIEISTYRRQDGVLSPLWPNIASLANHMVLCNTCQRTFD